MDSHRAPNPDVVTMEKPTLSFEGPSIFTPERCSPPQSKVDLRGPAGCCWNGEVTLAPGSSECDTQEGEEFQHTAGSWASTLTCGDPFWHEDRG